jgi:hypothetical protein
VGRHNRKIEEAIDRVMKAKEEGKPVMPCPPRDAPADPMSDQLRRPGASDAPDWRPEQATSWRGGSRRGITHQPTHAFRIG